MLPTPKAFQMTTTLAHEYELFQNFLVATDGKISHDLEELNEKLHQAIEDFLGCSWLFLLLKYIAPRFIDASLCIANSQIIHGGSWSLDSVRKGEFTQTKNEYNKSMYSWGRDFLPKNSSFTAHRMVSKGYFSRTDIFNLGVSFNFIC